MFSSRENLIKMTQKEGISTLAVDIGTVTVPLWLINLSVSPTEISRHPLLSRVVLYPFTMKSCQCGWKFFTPYLGITLPRHSSSCIDSWMMNFMAHRSCFRWYNVNFIRIDNNKDDNNTRSRQFSTARWLSLYKDYTK